jgi:hypothetical protein
VGVRGPKAAADLAGPIIPGAPVAPPDELEADERAVWTAITGRLPENYFTAEAVPMLVQLCRHVCYARELAAQIAARRKAGGNDDLSALMRDHGFQSNCIASLSTKLRLTPQARQSARRADQLARKVGAAPPPWEWERQQ